jgi:hypothetical protein
MPLFSIKDRRLERIKEVPFKSERKEIQQITEASLKEVFGYEFVKSELEFGNLRIDTLAFDNENKSFIIMEYKINQSFSVIDQGYAYRGLLLNNKADFILEYNEQKGKSLKRDDVDWTQSKVVFVSPQFTKYQKHEPETHLNPSWKYNLLEMLETAIGQPEKSHIIIATHDPLLVGGLTKKQVQICSIQKDGQGISIKPPEVDPIGIGVDGILTEIFGLNTTLDSKTQQKLDRRRELIVKKNIGKKILSKEEKEELDQLDNNLSELGFTGSIRDPLYTKFLIALRKHELNNKVSFQKLDREKQVALVKEVLDEIEAKRK